MSDTAQRDESIAVQRLARMSEAWKRGQPDGRELDAAYRRFQESRTDAAVASAVASEWPLGWHFAMGMGVGCACLLAVRLLGPGASPQSDRHAAVEAPSLAEQAPSRPVTVETIPPSGTYLLRGGVRIDVSTPVSFDIGSGEVVDVVVGGEVRRFEGPGVVEFEVPPEDVSGWSCEFTPLLEAAPRGGATGGVKVGSSLGAASAKRQGGRSATAEVASAESWAQVAQALSRGDKAAAGSALEQLGDSSAPRTRDAAKLALAQLWLSEGDVVRARPVLQELARQGATRVIRERAEDALSRAGQ